MHFVTSGYGTSRSVVQQGAEAAAVAVDFTSTTCYQPAPGNPGFSYNLLYNESVPAALPAFLALMDSCRLYGAPAAISVTSKPFPNPHPEVFLNPMTSIIAVSLPLTHTCVLNLWNEELSAKSGS